MILGQIKKKIEHDRVYYKLKLSVSWLELVYMQSEISGLQKFWKLIDKII